MLTPLPTALWRLIVVTTLCLSPAAISGAQPTGVDPPTPNTVADGEAVRGNLVNAVEGSVFGSLNDMPAEPLRFESRLYQGETIKCGKDGRVELLLRPGYYLRLSHDTEAHLLDLSWTNLRIDIAQGSGIVEVTIAAFPELHGIDWSAILYQPVMISTPLDEYAITAGGAYRFDVIPDGSSVISVHKGVVFVAGSRLTGDAFAKVRNRSVEPGAGGMRAADAFDDWSRKRAAHLLELNKALTQAEWYKRVEIDGVRIDTEPPDTRDPNTTRTVSAHAGLVSRIQDQALYKHGSSAWRMISTEDYLADGDRVKTTTAGGRVEIHPFPDIKLFVAGKTEILYREKEGGGITVELLQGSVVVRTGREQQQALDSPFRLVANKTEYDLVNTGTYQLNLAPNGLTEFLIYDGVVTIAGREIKALKKVVTTIAGTNELSLNKDAADSFYIWATRSGGMSKLESRRYALGGTWLRDADNEYTFFPNRPDYYSPYGGEYKANRGLGIQPTRFSR